MEYELKAYVAEDKYDLPAKRNSVRLIIRKLTLAPEEAGPQPSAEVVRDFLMSLGSLRVEASLDKQVYRHGESICVNVLVDNNSNKTLKKIRIYVIQCARFSVRTSVAYKTTVAQVQSEEGFPIPPSQTGWCKVYKLCPTLAKNRDKLGLAIDGDLKHEDTNLASSTIPPPKNISKEPLAITVQYKVKIRLILGFGVSDVCLELPFLLTHPSDIDQDPTQPDLACFSGYSASLPSKPCVSKNSATLSNVALLQLNGIGVDHVEITSVVGTQVTDKSNSNKSGIESAVGSVTLPLLVDSIYRGPDSVSRLAELRRPAVNTTSDVQAYARNVACPWPSSPPPPSVVSKADRRRPSTATPSTASEEDLLFEDFARFRIRSTAKSNGQPILS